MEETNLQLQDCSQVVDCYRETTYRFSLSPRKVYEDQDSPFLVS